MYKRKPMSSSSIFWSKDRQFGQCALPNRVQSLIFLQENHCVPGSVQQLFMFIGDITFCNKMFTLSLKTTWFDDKVVENKSCLFQSEQLLYFHCHLQYLIFQLLKCSRGSPLFLQCPSQNFLTLTKFYFEDLFATHLMAMLETRLKLISSFV